MEADTPPDTFKRDVELATEAVFMHSIALGHGLTHQEAAQKIIKLHEAEATRRCEALLDDLASKSEQIASVGSGGFMKIKRVVWLKDIEAKRRELRGEK